MAQLVLGVHLGGETFSPSEGPTGYARLLVSYRRPYATANGYVSVLIYNDKHWSRFFELIGRSDLLQDPRFSTHTARARHIDEAYCFVSETLATNTSEYWLQAFNAADIPSAPQYSVEDLIADPHLKQVGMLQDLQHPTEGAIRSPAPVGNYSKTPLSIRRNAPGLGEHTQEVLHEAGLADADIESVMGGKPALTTTNNGKIS
jgi:crotonobetainyl-CoA:carnitine CoA-transferase CaiB-like acyl-CoA transferase